MTWVLIVAAVAAVWVAALVVAVALCRAAAIGDQLVKRARPDVDHRRQEDSAA